jgi:gas vesicle protein
MFWDSCILFPGST